MPFNANYRCLFLISDKVLWFCVWESLISLPHCGVISGKILSVHQGLLEKNRSKFVSYLYLYKSHIWVFCAHRKSWINFLETHPKVFPPSGSDQYKILSASFFLSFCLSAIRFCSLQLSFYPLLHVSSSISLWLWSSIKALSNLRERFRGSECKVSLGRKKKKKKRDLLQHYNHWLSMCCFFFSSIIWIKCMYI